MSKIPVTKKPAELKSAILTTMHVFVGPMCSATAVKGATNADNAESHSRVNITLMGLELLNTALMRRRKSNELRGRANAPNQHDATMTAWQSSNGAPDLASVYYTNVILKQTDDSPARMKAGITKPPVAILHEIYQQKPQLLSLSQNHLDEKYIISVIVSLRPVHMPTSSGRLITTSQHHT